MNLHPRFLYFYQRILDSLRIKKYDVVLLYPPPSWMNIPPLGTHLISEYLNSKGFSTKVCDLSNHLYTKFPAETRKVYSLDEKRYWEEEKGFKKLMDFFGNEIDSYTDKIIMLKPKYVGLSVMVFKEKMCLKIIKRIKQKLPDVKIIVGGINITNDMEKELSQPEFVDAIVYGEGEETILELIRCGDEGKKTNNVKGAIVNTHSGFKRNIPRKRIKDLDKIPFPKYNGIDLSRYDLDNFPITWSRGCYGNCVFCEGKSSWGEFISRSPESIIEELKYLNSKFKLRKFVVPDPTLNDSKDNFIRICDLIIKNKLDIEWKGHFICRKNPSQEYFNKMRKAGCTDLYFGIETGSDKILKLMKKPFTIAIEEENLRLSSKAGIKNHIDLITGFPGESEKDFTKTIEFVRKNKAYIDTMEFVTECQIPEGTALNNNKDKYGVIGPGGYMWHTKDGNNLRLRQKRTRILQNLAKDLGIATMYMASTLNDGKAIE